VRTSAPVLRRARLALASLLALALAAPVGCAPRGPAPEFAGRLVDGQPFDLAAWRAAHAGRPVLLYFWAEWCPICKTTAGNVTNVSADWPVTSIAIQSGTAEQVAKVTAAKGYRWPTLPDPAGEVLRQFGLGPCRDSTDPDEIRQHLRELLLQDPDGSLTPHRILHGKWHKQQLLVRLAGLESLDAVQSLVGHTVLARRADLPALPPGKHYWHELDGLAVVDRRRGSLGQVVGLFATGAHE